MFFAGGSNRATLGSAKIQTCQQTIQAAFKEFAYALYRGGSQSYLEALESQRSLYSAEQDLISLRLTEQSNRVTLYKVMGGGWNP
ncbi:hypothetical protein BW686_07835 [Pseudomonas syringae]|uniref:Uncharacterized protein n=1 Tax=Pseudomonas syringae TaxID=317 RepID=A0A244ETS6_PSESX|nr:hypothetical protein BW686_07835 [Pseudomonas syringae]